MANTKRNPSKKLRTLELLSTPENTDWIKAVIEMLMRILHAKDPYTYAHCLRVAYYAEKLTKAAGYSKKEQHIAKWAGLLHDIGKITIPDHILMKPCAFTKTEMHLMQTHPTKSAEILQPFSHFEFFHSIIPGVLYHHEKMDGKGYPAGLKNTAIPLSARLILIADTFDAITTTRPYRKNLSPNKAHEILENLAGIQFDPELVKVVLKMSLKVENKNPFFYAKKIF